MTRVSHAKKSWMQSDRLESRIGLCKFSATQSWFALLFSRKTYYGICEAKSGEKTDLGRPRRVRVDQPHTAERRPEASSGLGGTPFPDVDGVFNPRNDPAYPDTSYASQPGERTQIGSRQGRRPSWDTGAGDARRSGFGPAPRRPATSDRAPRGDDRAARISAKPPTRHEFPQESPIWKGKDNNSVSRVWL